MKKSILLFIFCVSFFLMCNNVYAVTYQATITGNSVRLRTGPGTNYDTLKYVSSGSIYTLVEINKAKDEGGCSNGWYHIYFSGSTEGYVCSDYVTVTQINDNTTGTPQNDCEKAMQDEGFPASYWGKLCALKTNHPSWNFIALKTNIDWSSAVSSESQCGLSYIESSASSDVDTSCYNPYSSAWYPASSTAVAYYMDPRNFLSDSGVFQFEYLKYSDTLANSYTIGITSILKNANFYNYHVNLGEDFSGTLATAGKDTDVNPIFLSSRILQELGNSDSEYNLYSGTFEGFDKTYYGLYNFYNFGVSDSCVKESGVTYCGLTYAQKMGWNSVYNALAGGSSQISSYYIGRGQYSSYLQKFNVVPSDVSKIYNHQYMTNIAAPSSEAVSTYRTYSNIGILDSGFAFYIPVYTNMTNEIINTDNGAKDDGGSSTIIATPISTIVTSSGYHYSTNYISNISPNTNLTTVKSALESISGTNSVVIKNQDGNVITGGLIGTGDKIVISNSNSTEELNVIIKGDTSGDGVINALDLLQIQKYILGTYNLSGVYSLAGDTSSDGTINALDLLQVQKSILGTYTINQ